MGLPVRDERRRWWMGEGVCRCGGERPGRVERITSDPRDRTDRQHPLKGSLGRRLVNGVEMEQWQYEVTGAGRLWYCIDDAHRTVWLTDATVGHPKGTE